MVSVTLGIEKYIRARQLYILNFIKNICQENDIKYFLVGGSCLGAVKYCDFIPGDKDIDIGMLREDYDKFLSIVISNTNDNIRIVNCNIEEKFNWYYTKVCLNNTRYSNGYEIDYGIFVDVMPYDFVPSNKLERLIIQVTTRTLKILLMARDKKENPIISYISGKIDRQVLITLEKKLRCNLKNSLIVQNYFCGKRTDWFYLEEITNGHNIEFHQGKYFVPKSDRYLNINYNGWRIREYEKTDIYKYKYEEINDGIASNSDYSN